MMPTKVSLKRPASVPYCMHEYMYISTKKTTTKERVRPHTYLYMQYTVVNTLF
jgi:hypothetical protein